MKDDNYKSFCRICQAFCGVTVTVSGDRVVKVRGDRDDPMSNGYTCFKGLQAPEQHYGEGRLLHSLRRAGNVFQQANVEDILAESGEQLKEIVTKYGPQAVAVFMGTQSLFNSLDPMMISAFTGALGTARLFGTMTIDQSAKWIGQARLGAWDAGPQTFADSDVWLIIGSNPAVSMVLGAGANQLVFNDPIKILKAAKAGGMRLIVVDPRRSETAVFADLFLQPNPGRDAELAAAILHVILRENWHDERFCSDYVDGLEDLRRALACFTPDACAAAIGVTPDEIYQVARMFARDGQRGMAGTGTGPNMARYSNLAEHLVQVINVICGRFPRAGDIVSNPGVLAPARSRYAEVRPPIREWETGPKTRKHGLGTIKGTMMSSAIADEILHPGEGRVRAMICIGGNLAVALPDQARAMEALRSLDLLITIDPRLSATAQLSHYVIAPKLQYERPDNTAVLEAMFTFPFAHATKAIVPPPAGSDVVDDWYVLWAFARRLRLQLKFGSFELPMDEPPTTDDLLEILTRDAQIPIEIVTANAGGRIYSHKDSETVQPRRNNTRFQLLPADVALELNSLARDLNVSTEPPERSTFLLTVRRHRELMNSTASDYLSTWSRLPGNPAYFNPLDIETLGMSQGDIIEIEAGNARINARVEIDNGLKRGIVSISHGWSGIGMLPWMATNALVDAENGVQAINRMPIMTGIPVHIRRVDPDREPETRDLV